MAETWAVKIEEEEKERLSELIEQSGLSSKDFLSTMVTAYELSKAKETNPLLTQDIEELQRITNRTNTIFANIGERIQTLLNTKDEEYKKLMEEKQTTITLLTEKNTELKIIKEEQEQKIITNNATIEELNIKLQNEQELKETSQSLAEEYKQKINVIETEIKEHKAIREENKTLQAQINEQATQIHNTSLENEKLQLKQATLENELKEIKQKHTEEIKALNDTLTLQSNKEKLKIQEEYQNKLQEIQDQYNKKVQELLEKLENKEKVEKETSKTKAKQDKK